ncbi:MAG: ATP cone domain-containing protein [Patescibacteria group bacterium]
MTSVLVKKSGGDLEPFEPSKLIESLQRAGAKEEIIRGIVSEVSNSLKEGMSTHEIYKTAFELLRKTARPLAARYSLKRAVLELGPTGFPFEDFLAEIFRAKGFSVWTRQTLEGKCVSHEVDLVAERAGRKIIGEAKFHNELGLKSDLKVALYVSARVEDIRNKNPENKIEGLLITNTKFTKAATEYANCAGLTLIGWSSPRYGNLHDLIEETGAHPITSLTSLSRSEKFELIARGVMLCRDLGMRREELVRLNISEKKIKEAIAEGEELCHHHL